jgi:hypothetical protein
MAVVSIQIERRPVLKRYPDLDIIPGELKSFRHDADHGEQFIIQRKLLADDIRIPSARVSTAMRVNAGFFNRSRKP